MRRPVSAEKWLSAFWACLADKLSHPFVGAIEAFAAVVTGIAGSLFSTEIRQAIANLLPRAPHAVARAARAAHAAHARHGGHAAHVARAEHAAHVAHSGHAAHAAHAAVATDGLSGAAPTVFWWMLGTTALLHVVRNLANRSVETRLRNEFKLSARKLQDLVATNAPPDYLRELGMSFEKATVTAERAKTADEKRKALSLTLKSIAGLAHAYDVRGKRDYTFAANVMWFIPSASATPWDDRVAFRGPGTMLDGVKGIVALSPEYSATNRAMPDPGARAFALDVPHEKDAMKSDVGGRERWSVLPGAPLAYLNGKLEHFHPSSSIVEWVREYGNFAPSVADAVGNYFRENREIAGFMSIPLFRPMAEFEPNESRDVVGILNVHWSKVDILGQYGSAEKFYQTIYPLRMLLAKQVIEVQDAAGYPTPPPPTVAVK